MEGRLVKYVPAPQPFLVPGLLSLHREWNHQSLLILSGLGSVLGPRKGAGVRLGGSSPPGGTGDRLVVADAELVKSTGAWRGVAGN